MKPITLVNLSFFDKDEINIVSESEQKTFHSFSFMQKYINERLSYWSELYGKKLKVDPDSIETLIIEEAQSVLKYVCEFSGVDYMKANSELRDIEYIEARRFAINICFMRKMGKSSIGKGLGIDHTTAIYHINKHKDLCKYDSEYESRYLNVYEFVMEKISGKFNEDGSGKKINNHVK